MQPQHVKNTDQVYQVCEMVSIGNHNQHNPQRYYSNLVANSDDV